MEKKPRKRNPKIALHESTFGSTPDDKAIHILISKLIDFSKVRPFDASKVLKLYNKTSRIFKLIAGSIKHDETKAYLLDLAFRDKIEFIKAQTSWPVEIRTRIAYVLRKAHMKHRKS